VFVQVYEDVVEMCDQILRVLDGKDMFAGSLDLKSLQQRVCMYVCMCVCVCVCALSQTVWGC
jgi:ABC-type uncharacterized transport system ATPase subunit